MTNSLVVEPVATPPRDIRNYRIRIYSRGNDSQPDAADTQPVIFDAMFPAFVGTLADWFPGGRGSDHPAICVAPEGYDPDTTELEAGGAFWNAEATGAINLLGLGCGITLLPPTPRHGYRLTYEEAR